ncbi:hypothetical protein, partial [Prevotella corporis]|uniref:hypothetical protein n=1 Tax=Prevotella corporis TaxID=28128 RepID=UPI0031E3500F
LSLLSRMNIHSLKSKSKHLSESWPCRTQKETAKPELIGSFHLPVRSKKRTLLVLLLCLCKSFKEQLLNANAKFIAKASAKV